MGHKAILAAALIFTAVLGVLTIAVAIESGPDFLTAVSLLVVGLFGFGIFGALREQPPE